MVSLSQVKKSRALNGTPPQSYGMSLAIWDHTVLPSTLHKWTHPAKRGAELLMPGWRQGGKDSQKPKAFGPFAYKS